MNEDAGITGDKAIVLDISESAEPSDGEGEAVDGGSSDEEVIE